SEHCGRHSMPNVVQPDSVRQAHALRDPNERLAEAVGMEWSTVAALTHEFQVDPIGSKREPALRLVRSMSAEPFDQVAAEFQGASAVVGLRRKEHELRVFVDADALQAALHHEDLSIEVDIRPLQTEHLGATKAKVCSQRDRHRPHSSVGCSY